MARHLNDHSQLRPVAELFMEGWHPGTGQVNGNASHSWGKSNEQGRDLDACWNPSGDTRPITLQEMSAEEREVGPRNAASTGARC
jgi:hypothetical protein